MDRLNELTCDVIRNSGDIDGLKEGVMVLREFLEQLTNQVNSLEMMLGRAAGYNTNTATSHRRLSLCQDGQIRPLYQYHENLVG